MTTLGTQVARGPAKKACPHPQDKRTPMGGFGKADADTQKFFCRECQQMVEVTNDADTLSR